jgi:hypothetical protein
MNARDRVNAYLALRGAVLTGDSLGAADFDLRDTDPVAAVQALMLIATELADKAFGIDERVEGMPNDAVQVAVGWIDKRMALAREEANLLGE